MCASYGGSNPSSSRRRFMSRPCALLGARKTKTLRKKQVADALGDLARWTLSWDTQDDGVFVGGAARGRAARDQVLWSNVGHNYTGYKLLATWAPGSISTKLHDTMLDSVFTPPLKQDQVDALTASRRLFYCDRAMLF